jgi:phenylalanyl-tRNA synthetase beta chain
MQFPESWLREFCDPPLSTAELAERLTMAGLEVESMRPVAPPFRGVVVAEVLSVAPHPDADRLRLCRSTPGRARRLIVSARQRAHRDQVPARWSPLPPAKDGRASRPDRGRRKIRGVESRGMLAARRASSASDDPRASDPRDRIVGAICALRSRSTTRSSRSSSRPTSAMR